MVYTDNEDFKASLEPQHPKTVITQKKQRLQLFKLFVIACIAAATAVGTVVDVSHTAEIYKQTQKLNKNIQYSIETASVIHNLQKERGLASLLLFLKSWNTKDHKEELKESRKETDESIMALGNWKVIKMNGTTIHDRYSFSKLLQNFRSKKDVTVTELLNTYSSFTNGLLQWLPRYTASENLEHFAGLVFAYEMMIYSKEETGLEKALGGIYFLLGKNFTATNISCYNEKRIKAKTYLKIALSFSPEVKNTYDSLMKKDNNTSLLNELKEKRMMLISNNVTNPSQNVAMQWLNLMAKRNDLMLEVQMKDATFIQDRVNSVMRSKIKWLILRCLLLCFAFIGVPGIIFSLFRVQNAFYKYTQSLFDKVGLEQGRTEFLMRENARHVEGKKIVT